MTTRKYLNEISVISCDGPGQLVEPVVRNELDKGGPDAGEELGLRHAHHRAGPLAQLHPDVLRVDVADDHLNRREKVKIKITIYVKYPKNGICKKYLLKEH